VAGMRRAMTSAGPGLAAMPLTGIAARLGPDAVGGAD